jgi:hypothetical protein
MSRLPNGQQAPSPIGTVTIRQHKGDTPRAWVKVAQPDTWKLRAVWAWEQAGGPPVPAGFLIHHINGDSLDDRPINLALILRRAHPQFHADKYRERQTGRKYPPTILRCDQCRAEFQGLKRNPTAFCPACRKARRKAERVKRYQETGT